MAFFILFCIYVCTMCCYVFFSFERCNRDRYPLQPWLCVRVFWWQAFGIWIMITIGRYVINGSITFFIDWLNICDLRVYRTKSKFILFKIPNLLWQSLSQTSLMCCWYAFLYIQWTISYWFSFDGTACDGWENEWKRKKTVGRLKVVWFCSTFTSHNNLFFHDALN